MGAWGTGFFENDEALEFVDVVTTADSLAPLAEALRIDVEMELEAQACAVALAAAEIVALAHGRPSLDNPAHIEFRFGHLTTPGQRLIALAWLAVDTVQMGSQLRDAWIEADQLDEWNERLEDLKVRLAGRGT